MQQVGYHNANMIASKLRTTIDGQKAEMLAMLQEIATVPPAEETPAHDPPPHLHSKRRSTSGHPAINTDDSTRYSGK